MCICIYVKSQLCGYLMTKSQLCSYLITVYVLYRHIKRQLGSYLSCRCAYIYMSKVSSVVIWYVTLDLSTNRADDSLSQLWSSPWPIEDLMLRNSEIVRTLLSWRNKNHYSAGTCMFACIYIYVFICIYVCICMYIYIHTYIYINIYIYIHTNIHVPAL